MDAILHNIMMAVATALAAALANMLLAQARKHGVEISATQADLVRDNARDAILYVEEQAADYAARGVKKMSSREKLDQALSILKGRHPELAHEEASVAIHAALPAASLGALYDPTKSGQG